MCVCVVRRYLVKPMCRGAVLRALGTHRQGLLLVLATCLLDQAVKFYLLGPFALPVRGIVSVFPFFDLVLVQNRGISYGLFSDFPGSEWILLIVVWALILFLFFYLFWNSDWVLEIALGLIIGGALGNFVDRILHGSVIDFISLHVGKWYWYVFNLADFAITIGVLLFFYRITFSSEEELSDSSD